MDNYNKYNKDINILLHTSFNITNLAMRVISVYIMIQKKIISDLFIV